MNFSTSAAYFALAINPCSSAADSMLSSSIACFLFFVLTLLSRLFSPTSIRERMSQVLRKTNRSSTNHAPLVSSSGRARCDRRRTNSRRRMSYDRRTWNSYGLCYSLRLLTKTRARSSRRPRPREADKGRKVTHQVGCKKLRKSQQVKIYI